MPAPASSSVARQTVSGAFKELEKTITPADARDFPTITLQDVKSEVLKIENELASRQSLRNLRRLAPLFQGLEHYEKVMGVLCNGTPFLPWAWAPISLILRIASEHIEAFDHIIKAYSRISECLGRFAVLNHSFATNHDFQQTLAVFYADILEFHKHAYQFVRRSGWKLFFVTSWHRFQRRFDNIFENLQRHASLIDKEANAYNIAEAKKMRQEIRTWRDECTEQLNRTEEEQGIKQYNSIVSWLRVDESDQLNIFHTLLEESNKHPGTCDWILRNKRMASMLQRKPDIPLLWVQGAAGTGKSVISASIVKFMESAGSLVLSHFCNYAYPSSTKYDLILRSLILQLVRKDGDLAAHVYENYILGKRVPSIPILERLLKLLLSSISKEPRQTSYIWIVIDGVDECEPLTQNKTCSIISQVTSKASNSDQVVCKALVSCRFSTTASTNLRKYQSISLTEEKEHMSNSIRRYASQRLTSIYSKFQQLNLAEHDIRKIEDAITEKSDGMFLYARLVLDYLSSNIFFNGEEIKRDVYKLPAKLSEFYSKIVTQILVRLDSTSVERIKCALGWIAFSKRPLKKIELLSAIAFSSGDTEVELIAPQYMLEICATLIEERPDSRLGFIHVSVKEFLTSSSSNLVLEERDCLLQHGVATVTCLLAGIEAFSNGLPHDSHYEQMLVRVIRGLHSFHVYAKEFWTDYLLSLGVPDENSPSNTSRLFEMAIQLATKLDQHSPRPRQSKSTLEIAQGGDENSPTRYADDRIRTLPDPLLQDIVNKCLEARTSEKLEDSLQRLEAKGQPMNHTVMSSIPAPEEGVSLILQEYQATIRYILSLPDYPDITAADLESFKRQFRTSAYTCRIRGCPRATDGFEVQEQCYEHEFLHVRRLMCTFQGCQYPSFLTPRALKNHISKVHDPTPPRKSIRRVGYLPSRVLENTRIDRPQFQPPSLGAEAEDTKGAGKHETSSFEQYSETERSAMRQDYEMQLGLLEQQRRKRERMEKEMQMAKDEEAIQLAHLKGRLNSSNTLTEKDTGLTNTPEQPPDTQRLPIPRIDNLSLPFSDYAKSLNNNLKIVNHEHSGKTGRVSTVQWRCIDPATHGISNGNALGACPDCANKTLYDSKDIALQHLQTYHVVAQDLPIQRLERFVKAVHEYEDELDASGEDSSSEAHPFSMLSPDPFDPAQFDGWPSNSTDLSGWVLNSQTNEPGTAEEGLSGPASLPEVTTEGMSQHQEQSPMNQQENATFQWPDVLIDEIFLNAMIQSAPSMHDIIESQSAKRVNEMVPTSNASLEARGDGQQADPSRVGHMCVPEEVRCVEGLKTSDKMIYEVGLRALYDDMEKSEDYVRREMLRKFIMTTSRMIDCKYELGENGLSATQPAEALSILLPNINKFNFG